MQAGVIGMVDGTFDVVDSFADAVDDGDRELGRVLDVERVFSLPSGETAFAGHAAREYRQEREAAAISDGELHVVDEPRTTTRHTNFVGIPGEFVVVGSGDGTFAFDLIAADTNTSIDRATVDVDAFFAQHGDAAPWKAGFVGTGEDGVSGVLHGDDLRETHDLDDLLADSSLNQVGLDYRYDGDDVKMTAARSGYVELYQPRGLDATEYLTYLEEEVVSHVSR